MNWKDIRKIYPQQWLIIESLEAHLSGSERCLDRIAVIETCVDGAAAFERYQDWHREFPDREFYFVNTKREFLEIHERHWIGIRRTYENTLDR